MITSSVQFIHLANSQYQAAAHRATCEMALESVWWDIITNHPQYAIDVASNDTIPTKIIIELSSSIDDMVRKKIATKRRLPEFVQTKLTSDSHREVRLALASNPKVTEKTLKTLINDSEIDISKQAATTLVRRRMKTKTTSDRTTTR